MWNKYGYNNFGMNEHQAKQAAEEKRRQEEAARREREEWTNFVLECNNIIPGPMNDPRLFEEDSWW